MTSFYIVLLLSLSLFLKLIPNLYKYKSIKNIAIIQLQKLFIQGFPWLGLCVSITEGMSLISGWGTKIPHAVQCSQKKKKKNHSLRVSLVSSMFPPTSPSTPLPDNLYSSARHYATGFSSILWKVVITKFTVTLSFRSGLFSSGSRNENKKLSWREGLVLHFVFTMQPLQKAFHSLALP